MREFGTEAHIIFITFSQLKLKFYCTAISLGNLKA
jgi:hypothetical protein